MEGTSAEVSVQLTDCVGLQDMQDPTASCVKSLAPRGYCGTQS